MEEIVPGAIICRHCGSPLKLPKKKKKAPFWRSSFMLGLYTGIIVMVLLTVLYNKVF